jgi:hypothetical protein
MYNFLSFKYKVLIQMVLNEDLNDLFLQHEDDTRLGDNPMLGHNHNLRRWWWLHWVD